MQGTYGPHDQQRSWQELELQARQQLLQDYADEPDNSRFDFIDIVSNQNGVYASTGPNFHYAVFGRDSLEVAEDLLESHQELARTIILELAALQGSTTDYATEEEPGKILHEYRATEFEGEPVPESSKEIMRRLQKNWGITQSDKMIYYGSFDATPLFVRLVGDYIAQYGSDILSAVLDSSEKPHPTERTLHDAVYDATQWLLNKMDNSPLGLLEYKRMNQDGLLNQVWKDSLNSYLYPDGAMPNWEDSIASIELQGYAYDALLAAAKHVASSPSEAASWQDRAKQLQKITIDEFWMEDKEFFAQALDYDARGRPRKIAMATSNAGLLLDSQLLKGLDESETRRYVDTAVKKLCSDEFLTPYGLRCRAKQYAYIPNGVGYHSSFAVWAKETHDIIKGLRNHGYHETAEAIGDTIIHTVIDEGEFYELCYVDETNTLRYPAELKEHLNRELVETEEIPTPEPGQAWTISAFIALCQKTTKPTPGEENTNGEHQLVANIKAITKRA